MMQDNPNGEIFSGPGIRAVDAVLRNQRQPIFPARQTIPAGGYSLVMNLPIPVTSLPKPINGRSTLLTLTLKPGEKRTARLDFFYPPDATPPPVLMVTGR